MQFDIYFCTDGTLRANPTGSNQVLIPLTEIQQQSKLSDLAFWTFWWHSNAFFEKDITLTQFFSCIEPWASFLSELTHTDITAYLKEIKKPCLVTSDSTISWIKLQRMIHIKPETQYAPEDDISSHQHNLTSWLNSKKKTKLSGYWYADESYQLTGYKLGENEHYAVDGIPLNQLANTPIVLDKTQPIVFDDFYLKHIVGDDQLLFNSNAFGVCKIEEFSSFLLSKKTHSFREVVEGFFDNLSESPSARDELSSLLTQSINELDTFSDSITIPTDKPQVIIANGAFDSIIQDTENQNQYWANLRKSTLNNKNVILRLKPPSLAQPPELKLYGHTLTPNSKELPSDSDYKLLKLSNM